MRISMFGPHLSVALPVALTAMAIATLSTNSVAQDADSAGSDSQTDYQPPEFIASPLDHPDVGDSKSGNGAELWQLDLAEALSIAAKNNLGLVLERESLRVTELSIDVARGVFEPRVTGSYSHNNAKQLVASTTEGVPGEVFTSKSHNWLVGLSKRFSTGTDISLGFSNSRNVSLSAEAIPANYGAVGQVRLTQPLLRGFSLDLEIPRIQVLRAKLTNKRQRESVRSSLMEVAERTETAYWGLVSALKTYQVQKASLALAEAQMDLTKRQIRAGVLAPADEIEAESTLAQRELVLIRSKKSIDAASDQLRSILNLPRAKWSQPILPTDSPSFEPTELSAEQALKLAIKNRPEARVSKLDLKRAAFDLREANNNRLPQIDLDLSYSLAGQDERYRGALDEIGDRTAPAWSVLVSLTWTPLNRSAGAAAEIARSNKRTAAAQNDQAVLGIYSEVRAAMRDVDSARRELAAAARFRSLAERSLDAEQRKFQGGTSSNFLVAQRSESVAAAQLAELGALIAHRVAELGVEKATGQILESRKIELE